MLANQYALIECDEEGKPLSVVQRKNLNTVLEVEVGEVVRVRAGGGSHRGILIGIGKENMKLHFIGFCPEFNYMLLM